MAACNNGGTRGAKKNARRYPGVKGRRPDQAKIRKEEAVVRHAAYAALPLEAKKQINPKKFVE